MQALESKNMDALPDRDLIGFANQGNAAAFRAIMQRHNRRLYRLARGILRDDSEAEDAVQEAYVRAFMHLTEFRGDAKLSTWLTRIALNEALGRLRRQRLTVELTVLDSAHERRGAEIIPFPLTDAAADNPERSAARREIRHLLERAVDDLPEPFRIVFVMRAIEEMSVEETAAYLNLRPETVKTRLHRARRLLREKLDAQLASTLTDAFPFAGARCVGIADAILNRLEIPVSPRPE
ncbi:MAG TPA: RNA polymerase sigma factor [Chthoniobacterales bacterium]|nr:RNA polymerase sigma factor [Chthoniobacterales bacterium]